MSFVIEEDIDQTSSVYEAFYNKYYDGWSEAFQEYKDEMKNVSNIIGRVEKQTDGYSPAKDKLFSCFEKTPLSKVKVVIWTENPYSLDRSYANIYKEIKNNYKDFQVPRDNNIHKLAEQGILIIYGSMCHAYHNPKAYQNLWFRFTNIVIEILNEKVHNCIHLLWGKNCQKLANNINSREVYMSSDPSSYQFFGNNHFIKTNITLKRQGKQEIDWKCLS